MEGNPKTCKQAAEDFLCGDITYAKAAVKICETGDTRDLDYWIDRYFNDDDMTIVSCPSCETNYRKESFNSCPVCSAE